MIPEETRLLVEQTLGYRFVDPAHFVQAMTHASVAACKEASYERMEFLGDAVLGMVVSESLFRRYPSLLEGEMTKIKSAVVSRQTCAAIARNLGLDRALLLGKGMLTPAKGISIAAPVYQCPYSMLS